MFSHPTGGGKDSVYSNPTGGGKDSLFTHPTGGGKDSLCTVSYCIYPRPSPKENEPNSGKQAKIVPTSVEEFRRTPFNLKPYRRRIQTTLQGAPKTVQDTLHNQWLRRLQQTKCLVDCYSRLAINIVQKPDSLGFYSRLFLVPKPGNRWRPVIDLSCLNKFLAISKFKMETPESIRASLCKNEWVTSIDLTDAYLHIPIHPQSHKYLRFFHKGVSYQFTSLPFGLATAPLIFTSIVKEVRLLALQQGIRIHQYLDDWLIRAPSKEECHQQTQKLLNLIQEFGFLVNHKKSELVPSQRFDFLGYHFFTRFGAFQAHSGQVDEASGYVPSPLVEVCYQCKDSYVHHWITCINGEDSQIGQNAYETFSMASQDSLEISDASGHSNPLESEDDTTWGMVVRPHKCATRRVSPPKGTRKTDLYRRLKRRLGRTLRSRINPRGLVSRRKTPTYQPVRNEGSFPGSTVLQTHLQEEQSRPHCLRQHLCGVIHKQTGRYKICRTLRSYVENPDMVQPQQCHTQSKICTWVPQCDSGWPLKEESDPKHRMVPVSTSFQTNFQRLGESSSGPLCNQTEHKTPLICLSDPGSASLGCRRPEHSMGEPGCLCLSPNRPTAQGCTKTPVTNVQATSDRPRLAIKTVVLGPSGNVSGCAATASTNPNPTQTTNEQPFPHQPSLPQPPSLVSRSTSLQRGFTAEVAERIAAPQRLSTRAIYSSKWSVFQRWCMEQQVDFGSPSIGDICNFFWYLFHDLNRCPSTIEGYRTAIADTLGDSNLHISSNTDIARLIASFRQTKKVQVTPKVESFTSTSETYTTSF